LAEERVGVIARTRNTAIAVARQLLGCMLTTLQLRGDGSGVLWLMIFLAHEKW
jgi:hypothetical protein